MTAITINPDIKINSTPFCDKYCKGVRVFSQFVGRSLYALGLLVVSVACYIFNRDLSHTYYLMAGNQFNLGGNKLFTYFRFGNELVDFSYNGCTPAFSSDTELNALRVRYGTQVVDSWLKIGTKKIPLKQEKLARVGKGICFGMSLDFMKEYLIKIQMGISPIEAIREISSNYVNGASDKAQLAQIFYRALDITQIIEKEYTRWDTWLKQKIEETVQWVNEKHEETVRLLHEHYDQARALPEDQSIQKLKEIEAQSDKILTQFDEQAEEQVNNFRLEKISNKRLAFARISARRCKIISKHFGLQMGPPRTYCQEEVPTDINIKFTQFLENLQDGCYLGGFNAGEDSHAIGLIKSNSQYFLFEPNFGTFVFEQNAIPEKLWDIGKTFYLKNGKSSLSFSSCWLS
ncbi:MAG TPA: YopT-type cysteine protease domain-containing protein [Chlamydiales bacterium]|nr:YopT-type cysteine protease domain-containing protein [Chlamydiales bacterium]